MSDPRKDLPPVTAPNFLERLRETVQTYLGNRGDALDQGLTRRDLLDSGVLGSAIASKVGSAVDGMQMGSSGGGSSTTIINTTVGDTYVPDLTPPPTPSNFTVAAAISNLLIDCDPQTYTVGHGHAKSRLYGASYVPGAVYTSGGTYPVFSDAVLLTEFGGNVFSYATNPATEWHLWLTWMTVDEVESLVPAGGLNGVVATTGQDVALLLDALTGEITASQLYVDLGARINLIDDPAGVANSVNARIQTEVLARGATLLAETNARTLADGILGSAVTATSLAGAANGAAIASETLTRSNAVSSVAAATTALAAKNSDSAAALVLEQSTRTTADAAVASQITTMAAATGANLAALSVEQSTRTSNEGALSAQVTGLGASTGANTAGLILEQTARTTDTSALASSITSMSAKAGDNVAAIVAEQTVRATTNSSEAAQISILVAANAGNNAAIKSAQTAQATTNTSLASSISTMQSTVDGQTVALSTESTTRATQTGDLFAQYTVKIDSAGSVAGYGLASTLIGATPKSAFGVRADQFWMAPPVSYTQSTTPTATSWGSSAVLTLCSGKALMAAGAGGETILGSSADTWVRPRDTLTVAVDGSGNPTGGTVASSYLAGTAFGATAVYASVYANGLYVVAGASGKVASSPDGKNWTNRTELAATAWSTTTVRDILYANGKFYVVGDSGKVAVGTYVPATTVAADYFTWTYYSTLATAWSSAAAYGIRWQYGNLYAFGAGGKLAYSTDNAATWTDVPGSVTAMSSNAIRALTFGYGLMLVVGDGGKVATSTDGLTWTTRAGLAATTWSTTAAYVALWDGVKFVVAGALGKVATSPDGINWTYRPGLASSTWSTSTANTGLFKDGKFIVAGDSGKVAYSFDGITWSPSTSLSTASAISEGCVWVDTTVPATPVTKYYVNGSWVTTSPRLPFVVQSTPDIIDGVPVPAGVYADAAYVRNGTITNAKIGFAAIDDAKVASLSAAKLTAGTINVGEYIQSSGYVAGSAGWRINGNGNAEFSGVVVRGTVYASAGLIGGNTIDSTGMQSPGYVAGSSGWRLGSDGSLNAMSGSFKGSITGATGTFSGALSGATGTFAGVLSAATGSFAGSLSAATGSFAGSLSAATGSFSGSLSAATGTFSGTLTADAINAVSTINIGNEQVTVPRYGAGSDSYANSPEVVLATTASLNPGTGRTVIMVTVACVEGGYNVGDSSYETVSTFRLKRNGELLSVVPKGAFTLQDTTSGDAVYTVTGITNHITSASASVTILAIGCKK